MTAADYGNEAIRARKMLLQKFMYVEFEGEALV